MKNLRFERLFTSQASHFLTGPTFVPALLEFLETPWGSRFTNEVVIANNEIQAPIIFWTNGTSFCPKLIQKFQ